VDEEYDLLTDMDAEETGDSVTMTYLWWLSFDVKNFDSSDGLSN